MPQPRKYHTRAEQQAAYRQRTRRAQDEMLRQKGLPPMPAIPSMPGRVRWRAAIGHAYAILTTTASEMQEYHDDRSEQWQDSSKAADLLDCIDALEDIATQLSDAQGQL